MRGASYPAVTDKDVYTASVPLPPLETQRRIVAWLDEAFSHLQAIKERHAEAEREAAALLPAKLAEVFGRAEKEGWRWVRLGDITTLIKNKIDPRKFPEELFSLYSFPAYDAGQKPEVVRGSKIGSTKTIVQPGTVLFARLNPRIPRVWLVGEEHVGKAVASTEFLALFPAEPVDSQWLQLWLLSPHVREEVRSQVKGATKSRERISAEQVLSLILPLPPLETQRRIVEEIEAFEEEARRIQKAQEESRVVLEQLEKSLLAEAFRPERWV